MTSPPNTLETDITAASNIAYKALEREGMPAEAMHRLSVCHQASALIVDSLLENGHKVEHKIGRAPTVVEHSFVTLRTDDGRELLIDPTWQQFLAPEKITPELPRVLVGERSEVITKARAFGVDEETLKVWHYQPDAMSVEKQKRADAEADEIAEKAAAEGGWDKFTKAA